MNSDNQAKTDANNSEDTRSLVTVEDFLSDTKDFLDENFRGCYQSEKPRQAAGEILLSADAYANFLKIIFRTVFAAQMIYVSHRLFDDCVLVNFEFDTGLLHKDELSALWNLARESGFSLKITGGSITATFEFLDSSFSSFRAVSSRFVYKTLKNIVLS